MPVAQFGKQIDHLLWTGMIRGEQILKLYRSLKAYQRGRMMVEEMQAAIDQLGLDQWFNPSPEQAD